MTICSLIHDVRSRSRLLVARTQASFFLTHSSDDMAKGVGAEDDEVGRSVSKQMSAFASAALPLPFNISRALSIPRWLVVLSSQLLARILSISQLTCVAERYCPVCRLRLSSS